MKTFIIFPLVVLLLGACSQEEPSSYYIGASVDISVLNSEGKDLLNPQNEHSFDTSKIKLYHLIDDTKQLVSAPGADSPRGFFLHEIEGTYYIRLHLSTHEDHPTSYIQWNESDTDTLEYDVVRSKGSVEIIKIWFNGELKVDLSKTGSEFQIIK